MFKALLCFALAVPFQTASTPPVEQLLPTGLVEITMTIGHFEAGLSDLVPMIKKMRMCVTPQTVPPELISQASHLCKSSNIVRESGHTSMDLICQGMSSHVDIQTITPDVTRTTIHTIILTQNHPTTVDSTSEYRLVSSSCNSVPPGQMIPVQ